jgi:protein gp37
MTDLFGSWVPDDWIDKCFATMALTPQHTHQVLTKRPERMLEYMQSIDMGDGGPSLPRGFRIAYQADNIQPPPNKALSCWPMPNVWLGVSVEDQKRAGERIPVLLKIPAAVRFLSIEPMLGPVDLTAVKDDDWKTNPTYHPGQPMGTMHALKQFVPRDSGGTEPWGESVTELNRVHTIDWVITGCESGLGRRPWSLEWDQAIERQCRAAGVAFFRKQIVLDGRVSKDAAEWPEHLRVQEFPR